MASMEWDQSEPKRWATCALYVRAGEAELLKPFRAQENMNESQMLDINLQDLIILLYWLFWFDLHVGFAGSLL